MIQQFINRSGELKALKDRYTGTKPEFLIIYGRRRVGKTDLIIHSIRDQPNIYFLSEEKREAENIKDLQNQMADFLGDEEFRLLNLPDYVELFKSFAKRNKKRCVIVVDEFPYLVKKNQSTPSKFQKIWDLNLKDSNIVLILIGSSISMMEKLLGTKSPLHGRRTGQIEVKPLRPWEAAQFLPKYSPEDAVAAYGCVDGIPLYLKQLDDGKTLSENIRDSFLRRDAMLYAEAEILLKQEFRDTSNYFSILKAIAHGNTRNNEIVDYTQIDKTIISKYLQNLGKTRIIKKTHPATIRKEKTTTARYSFTDNYYRFWFRFIYPNKNAVEKEETGKILEQITKQYNEYMGQVFEKVSEDLLWKLSPKEINFTKTGRWWHKEEEIDLIAFKEETREITFFECKWSSLKLKDAKKTIDKLIQKSNQVDWNKNKRKESFGIFAKKIDNKEELRKQGIHAYDLEDMPTKNKEKTEYITLEEYAKKRGKE